MNNYRMVAVIGTTIVGCMGLLTLPASAGSPAAKVNLSRPLIPINGAGPVEGPNGISVTYSSNWSGYAALPKTAGETFTSIVANYNVPSVTCSATLTHFHSTGSAWMGGPTRRSSRTVFLLTARAIRRLRRVVRDVPGQLQVAIPDRPR